jgi:cytochrome c oxidase cbb3-type subunit I/II
LSIVHFWSLIFIYIWAGPHHLLYTALPGWAQALGTVFSLMLIAPSWGGMLNGLLTLRGAWDKVREDPVLKFLVVGVTAYGMATFEGPMLSIPNVNAIAHYSDYIIGHVHLGALLWNGGLSFAMLYYITPRIYNTKLYSPKLANTHFWFATMGAVFYVIPMYWSGITQSLMWKEFNADGMLQYPNFLETVQQIIPMYALRALGGTLFITGACFAVYNLWKTAKSGQLVEQEKDQAQPIVSTAGATKEKWHRRLESRPIQFTILTLVVILIGGIVEYVPTALIDSNVPTISSVKPYTPLEVEGRDIYISEGCNNCHSQMIRPFRSETERYGEYSKAGEFVYDHPFLWGSKRTGPDLQRVGGKYPDSWHLRHMNDPTSTSPGSIMPAYTWLYTQKMDTESIGNRISALRSVGVPYAEGYEDEALADMKAQAKRIADGLRKDGFEEVNGHKITSDKKIIALIAYLQRLGTDIKGDNNPFQGLPSSKALAEEMKNKTTNN